MNKIRENMSAEVEAFIPVIRKTYELIAEYQLNRTEDNEINLRLQLKFAFKEMRKFKPFLQKKWWPYFDVLERQERFLSSDLICTFDTIIH